MDLSLSKKLDELISHLDTWQGKLMSPPSVPENERFDLCAFIDSSRLALPSVSDFYVFPRDRYFGEESLNDVRRDLICQLSLEVLSLSLIAVEVTKLRLVLRGD